jgi:hypothetical protein
MSGFTQLKLAGAIELHKRPVLERLQAADLQGCCGWEVVWTNVSVALLSTQRWGLAGKTVMETLEDEWKVDG